MEGSCGLMANANILGSEIMHTIEALTGGRYTQTKPTLANTPAGFAYLSRKRECRTVQRQRTSAAKLREQMVEADLAAEVAPAGVGIANGVASATGTRIRDLPLTAARFQK